MARLYATREAVKLAASITGSELDFLIDRHLRSTSAHIEKVLNRWFIPRTRTYEFRWPPRLFSRRYVIELPDDLLAVTTLKTKAQNASPTTIASTDFFLEPQWGPPYDRIEIDLSSTAAFETGDTPQRSISVLGRWGFGEETESAGTVRDGSGINASVTTLVCSDGSAIDVGDTLLVESESIEVTQKKSAAEENADQLDGALTADMSNTTVTVDSGSRYNEGEIILVDAEKMFIHSISSNDLSVTRAFDGSVLAAHSNNAGVHVFRTLTIRRGANGTTAATHAQTTTISRYQPQPDVVRLCVADVIASVRQDRAAWGNSIGAGEGKQEFEARGLGELWRQIKGEYRNILVGAVV